MSGGLDFDGGSAEGSRSSGKRPAGRRAKGKTGKGKGKKKSSNLGLGLAIGVVATLVVGGIVGWKILFSDRLVTAAIKDQKINEMSEVAFTVPVTGVAKDRLRYALVDGPRGADLDAKTGRFTWRPTEQQGPGKYPMAVQISVVDRADLTARVPFTITVDELNQPPVITPIGNKTVKADAVFSIKVEGTDLDAPAASLSYQLLPGAPPGAKIDAKTGRLEWNAAGAQPRVYEMTVAVSEAGKGGLVGKQTFEVQVLPPDTPIDRLIAGLRQNRTNVRLDGVNPEPVFLGAGKLLRVDGEPVQVYEYPTKVAAADDARKTKPKANSQGAQNVYQQDELIVVYAGSSAKLLARLKSQLGKPLVVIPKQEEKVSSTPTSPSALDMARADQQAADAAVLALYRSKKMLLPKEYVTLRKIYATLFEQQHADDLRKAFGSDYDALTAWLDQQVNIKEEFFTAIDPSTDKVVKALGLFKDLWKEFPKQIEPYSELAIATAVTWDNPKAIYDYTGQQQRTHSTMPGGLSGPIDNFKYFLDAEPVMQGRVRYVPWEFLIHLVNQKTPIIEQQWALNTYLPQRAMFGKCYHDVPYDNEMLKTDSKTCKLGQHEYTLPNIRELGGVCAMQADFAARVGKSLGVPSEYVTGEARSGDLHAWVMWVELRAVSNSSIDFSLESHGRYEGDKYYVGTLEDPQSGKEMTDRELELRLQTVGLNAQFKRHTALVMKSYPLIRTEENLDATQQLLFLNAVIQMCPGNEAAWTTLAKMSREGLITKAQQKTMLVALNVMFQKFAAFPDFTWKIFDDFVSFQEDPKQRVKYFEQLVTMYEAADRPDLACECRLKLTDYLVAAKQNLDAIQGLAFTIKKFPDEGRYVPKLLDKLDVVCKDMPGASEQLVQFYSDFLPLVPQKRGDEPSVYCMAMLERGIERFKQAGQNQLAQACEQQLAKLRASNN